MDGRFLQAHDVAGLRAEAARASAEGATALFLSETALGDPIVLAAGLAAGVPRVLLGVRVELGPTERHPAMLARDMTCLDLVSGGRSVLCFASPFTERLPEAIALCRALWMPGEAVCAGPHFPVQAAANRARPVDGQSPLIALDLSAGGALPDFLVGAADLLLWPCPESPGACRLERV